MGERATLGRKSRSELLAALEELMLLGAAGRQIAAVRKLIDSPDAFVASLALEAYCAWGEPLGFDQWAQMFERGLDLQIAAAGCWKIVAQFEASEQERWLERQLSLLHESVSADVHDAVLLSLGRIPPDLKGNAVERLLAALTNSRVADDTRDLAAEMLARLDLSRLLAADLRTKLEQVDFVNALVEKRRAARSWLREEEFEALARVGRQSAVVSQAVLLLVAALDDPDRPKTGERCMADEMCAGLVTRVLTAAAPDSVFESAVSILVQASTVPAAQLLEAGLIDSLVSAPVRVDPSLMSRLASRLWREEPEATARRVDHWATLAKDGKRASASREKAILVLAADPAAADQNRSWLTKIAGAIEQEDSLKAVAIAALGNTRSFDGDPEWLPELFGRLRDDQVASRVAVLNLLTRRDPLSEAEFKLVISQLANERAPVVEAAERVLRGAAPIPTEAVFCLLAETFAQGHSRWLNRFLAYRLSGTSVRADTLIALFGLDEGEPRRPSAILAKGQGTKAGAVELLAELAATAGNKRFGVRQSFARTFDALATGDVLEDAALAKIVQESLPSIRRIDQALSERVSGRLGEAASEARKWATARKWIQGVAYALAVGVVGWLASWLVLFFPRVSIWVRKLVPGFEDRVREGKMPLHVLKDRKIRSAALPATLGHEPLPDPETIDRHRDHELVQCIAASAGPRLIKVREERCDELRVAGTLIREKPGLSAVVVDGGRLGQNLWSEVASFLLYPWEAEKYARELVSQGYLAVIVNHTERLGKDVRGSVWKAVRELEKDARANIVIVWAGEETPPVEFGGLPVTEH